MKSKYLIQIFALLPALIAVTSGCREEFVTNRQAETAAVGIHVYEAAEELYTTIEELDYFYKYNAEFLQILVKDSSNIDFSKLGFNTEGIDKIIELTHYTQKVYRSYEMLSDIGIGVEKSAIRPNFEMLATRLDSFKYDENKTQMLAELKIAAKAHKFEKKEIMFDISALYLEILERDINKRRKQMELSLNIYDEALQSIPVNAFDIDKVEPLVDAPLKNAEAVIKTYKLQLRDEAYQKQRKLDAETAVLFKAVQTLNRVHGEFIKQNKSNVDIDRYLVEIKETLNVTE